ncbi:MAG: hypothetical protein Q4D44_06500 [Eubacteriales bacterium]|nr:hypothetical protein [Eubacteriales bacterium]
MKKSKFLALVLVSVLVCSCVLTACNKQQETPTNGTTATQTVSPTDENTTDNPDAQAETGKPNSGSSTQNSGNNTSNQGNNASIEEEEGIPGVTAGKPTSDTGSTANPTRCTITAGTQGYTKNVGETFTYTCNMKTPKKIEDVQATLTYDGTMLRLISVSFPVTDSATVYNENIQNEVKFNAVNLQGFDFTKKGGCLVTAQFEVLKKGGTSISTAVEVMSEVGTGNAYVTNYKLADGVKITESGK